MLQIFGEAGRMLNQVNYRPRCLNDKSRAYYNTDSTKGATSMALEPRWPNI